jgi:hypothetical protein
MREVPGSIPVSSTFLSPYQEGAHFCTHISSHITAACLNEVTVTLEWGYSMYCTVSAMICVVLR